LYFKVVEENRSVGPRATSPQKRWLLVVDNKLTIIMVTPLILSYYILWLMADLMYLHTSHSAFQIDFETQPTNQTNLIDEGGSKQ
jgi:hypothetical protein